MEQKEGKLFFIWRLLLATISGTMIALAFPSYDYSFLAWFFGVFLLFSVQGATQRTTYLVGLTAGIVFILISGSWFKNLAIIYLNWHESISYLLAFVYAFWYGHIFALSMVLYRFLIQRLPQFDIVLFPSCFIFLMSLFPEIFQVNFAMTQLDFLVLIQPVEYTGVWGLCWIILFFNAFVYKIFKGEIRFRSWQSCLIYTVFIVWIAIGALRYFQWQSKIESWDLASIGFVQPNHEAVLGHRKKAPGYTKFYPVEMEMTEKLVPETDVVIWPEGEIFGISDDPKIAQAFKNKAKELNTHIILQDITKSDEKNLGDTFNSMVWIDNAGNQSGVYHKNILMPFGEYVPLAGYFKPVMKLFNFSISSFQTGKEYGVFDIEPFRIIPIICYESIFPEFVAESIADDGHGKFIVVVSQNGWYRSLAQVGQHSIIVSMRAVENRVPVLHVVNNGYSSLTLPDGRIFYKSNYNQKEEDVIHFPFEKTSGGSFYSSTPYLTVNLIRFFIFIVFIVSLFQRRNKLYG